MAHFTNPTASSLDRVAYLVGMPIAHSLSPLLHHTIYSKFGKNWGQVLVETHDLESFLVGIRTDPKFFGSGVTMPYKVKVIPYLDELTPEGSAISAINTIFLKKKNDGTPIYCGTNTDCVGIRDAFLMNATNPSIYRGKPGLVVGGGGTSRAAVYALQNFLGCSPIYMINRDPGEVEAVMSECNARGFGENIVHVSTMAQAQDLAPPGAIVSAVPDFAPVTEAEKTTREILTTFLSSEQKGAILEMCYHPSPITEIYQLADGLGWQVIMGTEAMIGQGLEQARLWTGLAIGDDVIASARVAVREALAQKHHI